MDQATHLRRIVNRRQKESSGVSLPTLTGFLGSHNGINTAETVLINARHLCDVQSSTLVLDFHTGGSDFPDLSTLFQAGAESGLADVLTAQKPLLECVQEVEPGLELISGAWGLDMLPGDLNKSLDLLIRQLNDSGERWNQVLLDLGTAANRLTRCIWPRLDQAVVITTNENEAILNAYAMIKLHSIVDNSVQTSALILPSNSPNVTLEQTKSRLVDACQRFLGLELLV